MVFMILNFCGLAAIIENRRLGLGGIMVMTHVISVKNLVYTGCIKNQRVDAVVEWFYYNVNSSGCY